MVGGWGHVLLPLSMINAVFLATLWITPWSSSSAIRLSAAFFLFPQPPSLYTSLPPTGRRRPPSGRESRSSPSLEELEATDLSVTPPPPPSSPHTRSSPRRSSSRPSPSKLKLPAKVEKEMRELLSPMPGSLQSTFPWLSRADVEGHLLPRMRVLTEIVPHLNMTRFLLHGSRVMRQASPPDSGLGVWEGRVRDVYHILRETLSDLETLLTLEHAPNILLESPEKLRGRMTFLQEHMVGCNVTSLVLGAPGLLSCHEEEGVFEARLLGNLKRLQEELPGVSAYMVISKLPRLLLKDFDTKILPKIQFFEQALPSADVGYMLGKNPRLLEGSTTHLGPRLDFIQSLLARAGNQTTSEDLSGVLMSNPFVLERPPGQLSTRMNVLLELFPPDVVISLLIRHPRTWTVDLSLAVKPQLRTLQSLLSPESVTEVLRKLPSVLYYPTSDIRAKLQELTTVLSLSPQHLNTMVEANPMLLASDISGPVQARFEFMRTLFAELGFDDFVAMMSGPHGARAITAGFGRLGRLCYIRQVHPELDIAGCMNMVTCSHEEVRRKYPGYECFLEEEVSVRYPGYTWEELAKVPFSIRERVHGEMLHSRVVKELIDTKPKRPNERRPPRRASSSPRGDRPTPPPP